MAEDTLKKVEMFCCLRDVLCTDGGVQEAVIAQIRARWKRFKDVADVLQNKKTSWAKLRGLVYKMYIRSAISYGAECWQ